MQRLGLALSGGGFRATLFHLGVVRFLRDAKILPKITHITSVSGGSVLGAHLVLNWKKYCGSEEEFSEVADEIIRFVQLDVRNRIVRRFPFASAVNLLRTIFRMRPARQLTRAGLLEMHYEKYLFGDILLSQLPQRPRLHILATNLNEGCLCSFNRNGLMLLRRKQGQRDRFQKVGVDLATVPMAVAASSAFPGFFPPLELNGWDVAADEGEFNSQAYTDGGVFDNLGLRMFRCIEQYWGREISPLRREDFLELEDSLTALKSASSLPEDTPLRRLKEMLDSRGREHLSYENTDHSIEALVAGIWEIIRSEKLYSIPSFQNLDLSDSSAGSLLNYFVETKREPEMEIRLWLNRQIVESALRQVIGKPCIRVSGNEFDGIIVSDAGGKLKASLNSGSAGLIRTALRTSDILMNRVWQLESEAFENTSGVLVIPTSDIVDQGEDKTVSNIEIQRQISRIRTDMDRFSDLEISALVQHGYCVARKNCRTQSEFFNVEIPSSAPWDPFAKNKLRKTSGTSKRENDHAQESMRNARALQKGSKRRVWSTLINLRDWPTYVWILLLISVFTSLPLYIYKLNEKAKNQEAVLMGIAKMNPDYSTIIKLLEEGPFLEFESLSYTDVDSLEETDYTGFEVLSDTRIFDLRGWSDDDAETPATSYSRLRIKRTETSSDNPFLRIQRKTYSGEREMYCDLESLNPKLSRLKNKDGTYLWELLLDFKNVPIGSETEVTLKSKLNSEFASELANQGRFNFTIHASTGLVQIWMLLPENRDYEDFEVIGYPIGKPQLAKVVVPHSSAKIALGSIATFRLINPEPSFRYECRWKWNNKARAN